MSLLEIANLSVSFGRFNAVEGVDLTVEAGEIVGIVGESGSGKSVTMMALMGSLDSNGHIKADRMQFDGQDLLTISERARRRIVGPRHRHDLPGSDDQPEPELYGGLPDHGGAPAAPGAAWQRAEGAGDWN